MKKTMNESNSHAIGNCKFHFQKVVCVCVCVFYTNPCISQGRCAERHETRELPGIEGIDQNLKNFSPASNPHLAVCGTLKKKFELYFLRGSGYLVTGYM